LEENSEDASEAIQRLTSVGKTPNSKVEMKADDFTQMEEPFIKMVGDVLQDRFNEKSERLFRQFYQFCLKHIKEGFN
jgi:hypothetical protein